MHPIAVLFILAATPVEPANFDIAQALESCKQMPIGEQRACVEPYLGRLPPHVAEALRYETDPAIQAAADAWQRDLHAALRTHAAALAARGGARNLLSAAVIMPWAEPAQPSQFLERPPEARAWFDAARTAEPAEPLVAWLEATDCRWIAEDCDRDAAIARLLEADPGNAAVQLLALGAAMERDDPSAIARHLHLAATADRFDPYLRDLLGLVLDAHEGIAWPAPDPALGEALAATWGLAAPVGAEDHAATEAFGRVMAVAYAGLVPVTRLCPADGTGNPAFADDCMGAYALVAERSDTLVDQYIALSNLSQLTAGDARGDRWREQLRGLYWLQQQSSIFMPGLPGSGFTAGEYARVVRERGELGALAELLRRNDVAVEPPADWLPEHPRMRSLVTTGAPARR